MKVNLLCKLFGHQFGEWEYIADDSCKQVRVCKRDGYQATREGDHQFGEWEYIADDSCKQVRVCKRDGYQATREGDHQWLLYDDEYHRCQRCLNKEPHDWTSSTYKTEEEEYISEDRIRAFRTVEKEITVSTCRKCGKVM